jgi:hypothetical protein
MALLRLHLEIDSDVHPELYARLASLASLPARHEKLKQLAATGLLWELLRLHGPALMELGAEPALPGAAPPGIPMSALAIVPSMPEEPPLPDLGLDAVPVPPPMVVPRNLPVLLDVVGEDAALPPQDVPSVTMATVVALRGDLEQPQVVDGGAEEATPQPLPVSRHGRSSRLKRMKDRGLFHNG